MFRPHIEEEFDRLGIRLLAGQEYALAHNFADFQCFLVSRDVDRDQVRAAVRQAFEEVGYVDIQLVRTAEDRSNTSKQTDVEYFTIRVRR